MYPVDNGYVQVQLSARSQNAAGPFGESLNSEHAMKSLLALVTLALTALIFEEKAREVAVDAQHAYSEAANQAREATKALSLKVERQPLLSLLVAGGIAYALASIIPRRS
jgi:short subunit fatty acids transporter